MQIARLSSDFIMPAHARNFIFPAESPVTERPIRHRKQARTMLGLCMVERVSGVGHVNGRYELLRAS